MAIEQSRVKNTSRNVLFGAISYIVKMLLQFFVRAMFNRYFIVEYLGLNGLFSNVLNVLSLAELGVGNAIIYSMYKPVAENDTEKIKSLLRLYRSIYTIIGIVVIAIGAALIPALPFFIKDTPNVDINLTVIYLLYLLQNCVGYFFAYRRALIFAYQRNDIESKTSTISQIALATLQLLVIVVWKNYYVYTVLAVLCSLLDAVLIFIISFKIFPDIRGKAKKIERDEMKVIAKNTGALACYKLGSVAVFSTDSIIISAYVGLGLLGIYSNYALLTATLTTMFNLVMTAIQGSVGNLIASSDNEHAYKIYKSIDLIVKWMAGFCFIGLMICTQDFMTYFTGDADRKLTFFALFLVAFSFYITTSRRSVGVFKDAAGLFMKDWYVAIIEALLNLGLDVLFVQFWGLNGVIFATILTSICIPLWVEPFILYKYYFKKNLAIYILHYLAYLGTTAIAYALTFLACNWLPASNIGWFVLKFAICVILPNLFYFLCFFKTKEFKYIQSTVMNLKNKRNNSNIVCGNNNNVNEDTEREENT